MHRLASAVAVPLLAATLAANGQATLESLRHHARVLLIFTPTSNDGRAREQLRLLDPHREAAEDRELVTVMLSPGSETVFSSAEQSAARKRFRIATSEFCILLIGKDGGEKLRSSQPIAWDQLAATIDAMPMRQTEMRRKQRAN